MRVAAKPKPEVKQAQELADEIYGLADEMPERGEDFGMSVCEQTGEIMATIEQTNRVTDAQWTALENMRDGLAAWFRNR